MEAVKENPQVQKYPAYKDSKVEWLGVIPEHWEIKKLGALLNPISKKNNPDLPLLSITREKGVIQRNIEDENENHNFIPDDLSGYKVLRQGQFGMNKMKAWQGSYGVSKYTGIVSPAYYVFDFLYEVDPEFFNIAIKSKKYISFFGSASDGVRIGQWDLSKGRMKSIPFLLPPKQEQIAIANFLDEKCGKIDTAIAQKQKLIELLKERMQIIIQNAVTKGLDPDVRMKDSGVHWIGEIPMHWKVKRLKYVFRIVKRIARELGHSVLSITQKGIKVKDINSGEGQLSMDYSKYQLAYKGDFAMNHMDLLTGYVDISKYVGVISPDYRVFKLIEKNSSKDFMLLLLQMGYHNKTFYAHGRGVAMLGRWRFPSENFNNFLFPIPPKKEQERIVSHIQTATKKVETVMELLQQQIEKLKEYKSSLIDAAVTGKIKVS